MTVLARMTSGTRLIRDSKKSTRDPIKVYDARWEVDDFDDAEVTRLFEATLAYGRLLGVDTVTLTRDARLGCPRLLEIGINTAVRMGFRVIACGDAISTPQGYFLALRTSARHPQDDGPGDHRVAQSGAVHRHQVHGSHRAGDRPRLRTAGWAHRRSARFIIRTKLFRRSMAASCFSRRIRPPNTSTTRSMPRA